LQPIPLTKIETIVVQGVGIVKKDKAKNVMKIKRNIKSSQSFLFQMNKLRTSVETTYVSR